MPKKKDSERIIAYKQCFSSEAGVVVLQDLMRAHNFFGSSFSSDPLEMARMEGERNAILRICKMISFPHRDLQQLMKEEDNE